MGGQREESGITASFFVPEFFSNDPAVLIMNPSILYFIVFSSNSISGLHCSGLDL